MYFPFCIQKLIYSGSLGQKVEVFMFEANSTRKYVFFKENKFGIDVGAPIYIYLIMMTMKLGAQRNVGDWGEDGDEHQSALGLWGSYEVCVFISTFVRMYTVQVLPAFLRILREPTPISIRLSGSTLSETWYRRKYLKILFNTLGSRRPRLISSRWWASMHSGRECFNLSCLELCRLKL